MHVHTSIQRNCTCDFHQKKKKKIVGEIHQPLTETNTVMRTVTGLFLGFLRSDVDIILIFAGEKQKTPHGDAGVKLAVKL